MRPKVCFWTTTDRSFCGVWFLHALCFGFTVWLSLFLFLVSRCSEGQTGESIRCNGRALQVFSCCESLSSESGRSRWKDSIHDFPSVALDSTMTIDSTRPHAAPFCMLPKAKRLVSSWTVFRTRLFPVSVFASLSFVLWIPRRIEIREVYNLDLLFNGFLWMSYVGKIFQRWVGYWCAKYRREMGLWCSLSHKAKDLSLESEFKTRVIYTCICALTQWQMNRAMSFSLGLLRKLLGWSGLFGRICGRSHTFGRLGINNFKRILRNQSSTFAVIYQSAGNRTR